MLASVIFVTLLAQVLLYPGIADLVEALGATTDLDASMWFLAAEFAAFICFAGVWGAVSDRFSRRVPFIALGALGGATGYLILVALPVFGEVTFGHVLAVRVFQGAATIGAFSLAITMLMDLDGGHGRNMGAAGIAIGSGTALGSPIGGQLSLLGPLVPLLAAAACFLLLLPLLALVRDRAPPSNRPGFRRVVADTLGTPSLGLPFAFGFVDRLTAGFMALVGVFYFREIFDLDPGQTGLMLLLFFGPFALLQYPFGRVSDRIGRFIPVVGGSACYGGSILIVGLTPTLETTAVSMLIVGIFGAMVSPATMALVTDLADDTRRGSAMAGFNVFGSLGFLTGILLGGTIAGSFGFLTAFALIGSMEILIAVAAIPFFRRLSLPGPTSVTG